MTAVDLRPGVIRYESALWETTALALHAGGQAVLVDPCISAPEIAAIAADSAERGLEVRGLLITHSDWDHVCGIASFPDVPAIMSTEPERASRAGRPPSRSCARARPRA